MTVSVEHHHDDLPLGKPVAGFDEYGNGADRFNEYILAHRKPVKCLNTPNKGRILLATQSFKQGEVVMTEVPLRVVQEAPENGTFKKLKELCTDKEKYYDALWYWCALNSLTEQDGADCTDLTTISQKDQDYLLLLHHNPTAPCLDILSVVEVLGLKPEIAPKLQELLVVWIYNCFTYSHDPDGFSTQICPSMMSHSCNPTVVWNYDSSSMFVLRALRDIEAGDEITIRYISLDMLYSGAIWRRTKLKWNKAFWCSCDRCTAEYDDCRALVVGGELLRLTPDTPMYTKEDLDSLTEGPCVKALLDNDGAVLNKVAGPRGMGVEELLKILKDEYLLKQFTKTEKITSEEQATTLVDMVDQLGAWDHHFLGGSSAASLLVAYYSSQADYDKALYYVKVKKAFMESVTKIGLRSSLAWVNEEVGDLTVMAFRKKYGIPGEKSDPLPSGLPLQAEHYGELRESGVVDVYNDALKGVSDMFGKEHKYYADIRAKRDAVISLF